MHHPTVRAKRKILVRQNPSYIKLAHMSRPSSSLLSSSLWLAFLPLYMFEYITICSANDQVIVVDCFGLDAQLLRHDTSPHMP
jgi:hypothetical protein